MLQQDEHFIYCSIFSYSVTSLFYVLSFISYHFRCFRFLDSFFFSRFIAICLRVYYPIHKINNVLSLEDFFSCRPYWIAKWRQLTILSCSEKTATSAWMRCELWKTECCHGQRLHTLALPFFATWKSASVKVQDFRFNIHYR